MKLKSLLFATLLCAASAFAQGIIQFDWQGDQNLYQASFQVNQADYALGWPFSAYNTSPPMLFQQTLAVTTPDRVFGPGNCDGASCTEVGPEFWHNVTIYCDERGFNDMICLVPAGTYDRAAIYEYPRGGLPPIRSETGAWIVSVVPEPSAFALLGLGLLGLCMRRATSRV